MAAYLNILRWGSTSVSELLEAGNAIVTFESPAPDALLSFDIDDPCPDPVLVEITPPLDTRPEVVDNPSTLRLLRGGVLGVVLHATGKPQPPIDMPHVPGLYYKIEDRNRLNHAPGHDDSLELYQNRELRAKIMERQLAYLEDPRGLFFQFFDIIIPSKEQRKVLGSPGARTGLPYLKENTSNLLASAGADIILTPPLVLYESVVPNMSDSKQTTVYSSHPLPGSKEVQMRKDVLNISAKVFAYDPEKDSTAFGFLAGLETRSTFVWMEVEIPTSEIKLNGKRFIIRPSFDLALIK